MNEVPNNTLSLGDGFLIQAACQPDRLALVIGERAYTYGECAETARRWAARLTAAAQGRPSRVGILASRSETSYVGVLATLFAGAAFVPLNPKLPVKRTRAMMAAADVDAVLVDRDAFPLLPDILDGCRRQPAVLAPDTSASGLPGQLFNADDLSTAMPLSTLPRVRPDDLAYLLFTSGTTGAPKGVPITHGNARAFFDVNRARYGLTPEDRLTQIFEQTFDLSVFDLFMAWENGASVHVFPQSELLSPYRFLETHEISLWFSVPSVAALLLKRGTLVPRSMPTLRWSLFCGEGLPRAVAEAWQAAAHRSTLENLYGPTELTIACAAYRWDPARSPAECVDGLVPVGALYAGMSPVLINETSQEVPAGTAGELCVRGPQVFPGYWRTAELSTDTWLDRPGPNGVPERYFRTGDIVRQVSGQFVFLGRRDHRVKLAGHRVELHEIEAALRCAGCAEAVVLGWPSESHPEYTVAVVSGREDSSRLASSLKQALPPYMVPRHILHIDDFPLSGNGKCDRGALRTWVEREIDRVSIPGDVTRTNPSELIDHTIAATLGIRSEQLNEQLGYHSIPEWDSLAHVRLIVALEEALGAPIPEDTLPRLTSVARIRAFAAGGVREGRTPYSRNGKRVPSASTVRRGLHDVYIDNTGLSHIDGKAGVLEYCGYDINDLVEHSCFEETASLLLSSALPDSEELTAFTQTLASARALPPRAVRLARILSADHPMNALRTAVSALAGDESAHRGGKESAAEAERSAGIRLIAQIPTLIATHHAVRAGRRPPEPVEHLSHAGNLLAMLTGRQAAPDAVRILDRCLIIHADHGCNASTFASRVAVGTDADLYAAITAAIATFAGPLHGGAAEGVLASIDEIGTPAKASSYVKRQFESKKPVMGFGHRVYRCTDPRVAFLQRTAHRLSESCGSTDAVDIVDALVRAMKPYARYGLHPNVDLYAGVLYRLLGLPDDLAGVMFVAGRVSGWVAHVLEQRRNNVLIRPGLQYVGPTARTYTPLCDRGHVAIAR
jgi:amino acid adenylation domain-containing protein